MTYAYNITSRLSRGNGTPQSFAIPDNATAADLLAELPEYTGLGDEDVTRCVWGHTLLSIDLYIDADPLAFTPTAGTAGTDIPVWPGRTTVRERRDSRVREDEPGVVSRGAYCGTLRIRDGKVVAVEEMEFVREFEEFVEASDPAADGGDGARGVPEGGNQECECSWGMGVESG